MKLPGKLLDKTFWRFIIVGVINTLVGTAVMFGLYNLAHASYWVSSAANYIVGSIVSYFLNKYYTFEHKGHTGRTLVLFTLNITVCYLLAYGMAKPAVKWALTGVDIAVQENIAMLVGMVLFVGLNYLGQRLVVFRKGAGTNGEEE